MLATRAFFTRTCLLCVVALLPLAVRAQESTQERPTVAVHRGEEALERHALPLRLGLLLRVLRLLRRRVLLLLLLLLKVAAGPEGL